MRVVAALPAENQRAGNLRVPELPVRTLATGHEREPGLFKVGDQLANLARHTPENATPHPPVPASIPAAPANPRHPLAVPGLGENVGHRNENPTASGLE